MPEYYYYCSKCDGRLTYIDESGEKAHCECKESIRETEIALCDHRNFHTSIDINRLEDEAAFSADIRVHCSDCGMKFIFIGCPGGLDPKRPTISPFGAELRAPIQPISPIVREKP